MPTHGPGDIAPVSTQSPHSSSSPSLTTVPAVPSVPASPPSAPSLTPQGPPSVSQIPASSGLTPSVIPPTAEVPDLRAPSLYLNRELSWIEFNARVLAEAESESVPLLERLKFSAIAASNLDEFFMV